MAGKARHRVKKSTVKRGAAGSVRRTSQGSRAVHRASSKAKAVGRTKTNQGAQRGMSSSKNKKTTPRTAPRAVELPAPPPAVQRATQRQGFKTNEFIVYPSHGVGQIVSIEEQEVAGYKLELFVINFVKDKMTLRVPTAKIASVGMRKLAEAPMVRKALETLKGRARIKRTMWSRRAQEYEAKINSGDIVWIAEVVRDLYRSESQPEQSYSERQLYEAALDRLSREISAVQRITETEAIKEIEAALAKGPRRGPKPAEGAEALVEDEAA
ncbi:MAG TPA: CarD family transcriptional regulator [Xanthobacteraceae bacterium]|nr:CarD family transcriptional regulator [Xanthobacteraceae bacterium]